MFIKKCFNIFRNFFSLAIFVILQTPENEQKNHWLTIQQYKQNRTHAEATISNTKFCFEFNSNWLATIRMSIRYDKYSFVEIIPKKINYSTIFSHIKNKSIDFFC